MKNFFLAALILSVMASCRPQTETEASAENEENERAGEMTPVSLTDRQVRSLSIQVDTLTRYAFKNVVVVNGYLNVPPQNKASVTAVIGANVRTIRVFEGDRVRKGDLLAQLTHPDLLDVQSDYVNAFSRLAFLKKEYERQQKLYAEKVSSGKEYQQAQADYFMLQGTVLNLEARLRLLHLDPAEIRQGKIYEKVPVLSPIEGYIEKVNVQTGQYVEPQKTMFEVVNNDRIHVDLMVFERDVYKVKEGQKVVFTIESLSEKPMTATVFAVGKTFEQNPKAVYVHASIDGKHGLLIPGMYITGRIATAHDLAVALPESAVVNVEGKSYIFTAEKENDTWTFDPVEVMTGRREDGWTEIRMLPEPEPGTQYAWTGAYYILSEMKKGETGEED